MHKDPFTASGISDAFGDAGLLAGAIDAGLSGGRVLEETLAAYAIARDAAVLPHYEEACAAAAFTPPPAEVLRLRAAVCGNQQATDRYLGIGRGTVSPEEFAAGPPDAI